MKKALLFLLHFMIIVGMFACKGEAENKDLSDAEFDNPAYSQFIEKNYNVQDCEMILKALDPFKNLTEQEKKEKAEKIYEVYLSELFKQESGYEKIEKVDISLISYDSEFFDHKFSANDGFPNYSIDIYTAQKIYYIYGESIVGITSRTGAGLLEPG